MAKSGAAPAAKPSTAPPQKNLEHTKDPRFERDAEVIRQRTQGTTDENPSKKARKEVLTLPIPKSPAAPTPVHHLFAKYGHLNVSEVECTSWIGAGLEENADSVTKCLSEAFIRQASHIKELKNTLFTNARLDKEVKFLKFKLEEDRRSLMETHKLTLETDTAGLRFELKKTISDKKALDKALKEAENHEDDSLKKA